MNSDHPGEHAPPPIVWFDEEDVVDGVVAVFGPVGVSLATDQQVRAERMDGRAFEATVVLRTPMSERDIAAVRVGAEIGSSKAEP